MKRRAFVGRAVTMLPAFAVLGVPKIKLGQELQPIELLKPAKDGGKSLLASIQERKTIRSISPDPLSLRR